MMFFSLIDFSSISMLRTFCCNSTQISISDIVSVQCEVFVKTKQAFSGICNNIINDINIILTSKKTTKTFIDLYNFAINKEYLNYCFLLVVPLIEKIKNINYCNSKNEMNLFFFGFIFLFILKYLGLLFTFGKITISQQYKKAYSM